MATDVVYRAEIKAQLIQHAMSDEAVVRAAKVSTLGEEVVEAELTAGGIKGLINFLMRDRHGSPFEHNSITFMVTAPMVVFWQLVRHRVGWSYNLESGRYKELGAEFYIPDDERPLRQVGKPGAYEFVAGTDEQREVMWHELNLSYTQAWSSYQNMLKAGIAREVARLPLPFGVYFHGYVTCNARSLMNFLSLRTKSESAIVPSFPQHEINELANLLEAHWADLMPVTHRAFTERGRVAP